MALDERSGGPRIPGVDLGEILGSGSSSVVYRGICRGVPCAVKIGRGDARTSRWLRREAAALARVVDPGLPAVREVGEADGVPYLVMELVHGETLASCLRRGPLPTSEAVRLAVQLARTLNAVHRRGLVHRDVKPDNVVLESNGGVRLVDFGFATVTPGPTDRAGTRAYSAPEQLRVPAVVDARTDLYALGRVLLECLTGERGAELDSRILDPGLRVILGGLLHDDPGCRYADALMLREDLVRLLEGQEPLGPQPAWESRPEALPTIGREAELAQLLGRWGRARDGRGGAILVRGPRGSGKTHLGHELARTVRRERACVVRVGCGQLDPRPLATLRGVMDAIADHLARTASDERDDALPARLSSALPGELAPLAAAISPALGEVLKTEPIHGRRVGAEVFVELASEILVRLLRVVAPALVVIDDMQWVDPASSGVLARLVRRVEQASVLVVWMVRSEDEGALRHVLRELPEEGMPQLALESLSEAEAEALVVGYLGVESPPDLGPWVARVADGTPLGVLEVLDAMVEAAVLDPRDGAWRFDVERAERMHLPRSALALFERKLRELPDAVRAVFEAAAVLGPAFEAGLLAEVAGVASVELDFALLEGRRAGLLLPQEGGTHRFVHDSVREALLGALGVADRRAIHQRVAEVLDARGDAEPYNVAIHYAAGEPGGSPRRVLEVMGQAVVRALESFDNEAALRFFEVARSAAESAGVPLPTALITHAAEAELRLGGHTESVALFSEALARTTDRLERATILGRIAWAHQARADATAAWSALAQAFEEVGHQLPVEAPTSALRAALAWGRGRLRLGADSVPSERSVLELLCELHHQNVRLGVEYGKPLRIAQSTLQGYELATKLGPGPTLAKMEAVYGAMLSMVGAHRVGDEHLECARQLAVEAGSSSVEAYCAQLSALGACFAGDFDRALSILRPLIEEHAHWLEMNDLASNVHSAHLIESIRGRPREARRWLTRGIDRMASHRSNSSSIGLIAYCAGATWASLHLRFDESELLRHLHLKRPFRGELKGFARVATWGSRARFLTERADLGPEFDALLREFEEERISPRSAHPILADYYIAVVQGRVHQCFRAPLDERRARAGTLAAAISDLSAVARLPLFKAHLVVAQAAHAWFTGAERKVPPLLEEAERLADSETAPRVLYDVARLRAHMLRARGKTEASLERARVAAHIARDQGAVQWELWIEEELGVRLGYDAPSRALTSLFGEDSSWSSSKSTVSKRRRQLQSLLHVLQAGSRQLELDDQARLLVDELVASVRAERGLLVFEVASSRGQTVTVGRQRDGSAWVDPHVRCHALMDAARDAGLPQLGAQTEADQPHAIAVPLWLKERPVGAIYLERPSDRFSDEDLDILLALSYQVPVALELARTIRERARLEESLRQAQKMEAIGRFAGGIAHDFNNMLTVVITTLDLLSDRPLDPEVREDLAVIEDAVTSAGDLTRRLLGFARRQPQQSAEHDLNLALADMAPMLRRLLGRTFEVRIEVDDSPALVNVDRGAFEQAILNLALNARDAMAGGGTLRLATRHVSLTEEMAREIPNAKAGPYVCVIVSDDGAGMPREVRDSAFEPFFTTKDRGKGSGLGLSMVYGFAHQNDGFIELESEVGEGTVFRIHLPAVRRSSARPVRPDDVDGAKSEPPPDSAETILVVDDEEPVRTALLRVLAQHGYRVWSAERPASALEIASRLGDEIDLVITDVLMPEMTGPELARAIREHSPSSKLLFISGNPDGELGDLMDGTESPFLPKPFRPEQIRVVVRRLLDASPPRPG